MVLERGVTRKKRKTQAQHQREPETIKLSISSQTVTLQSTQITGVTWGGDSHREGHPLSSVNEWVITASFKNYK